MSPRALFLFGALSCACALVVASLGWNESDAPLGSVLRDSGATEGSAGPVEGADHASLVDPVVATSNSTERVDVLAAEGPVSRPLPGEVAPWTVRFTCIAQEPAIESLSRLEVAVDGPGMDFEGVATRVSGSNQFEFTAPASGEALLGAALFAATGKRALHLRSRQPFHWAGEATGYYLGEVSLVSAKVDAAAMEVTAGFLELLPPKFLGHVLRGEDAAKVAEFYVWTLPEPSRVQWLRWDASQGGWKIPFGAFVSGGRWGAGDKKPHAGDDLLPFTVGVPVGADVSIHNPQAFLKLSVDLAALPDARSVLVREAASGVPQALNESELNARASALGFGLTTLSDKVLGRGAQEDVQVGQIRLPSGEYAVEAWSKPDSAGLSYLVASKTVTLTVGTTSFQLK